MLGFQGPRAEACLSPLTELDLPSIRYYAAARGRVAGLDALVARTGYTGEDGFELIVSANDAGKLWQILADSQSPLQPTLCGLGARDTLRLEAGMPLSAMSCPSKPILTRPALARVVKLDKGRFPAARRCRSLALRRRVAAWSDSR